MMAQDPWLCYTAKGRTQPASVSPSALSVFPPPGIIAQIEPTAAEGVPEVPQKPEPVTRDEIEKGFQEIETLLEANFSESTMRDAALELAAVANVPWNRTLRARVAQKSRFLQGPAPEPSSMFTFGTHHGCKGECCTGAKWFKPDFQGPSGGM